MRREAATRSHGQKREHFRLMVEGCGLSTLTRICAGIASRLVVRSIACLTDLRSIRDQAEDRGKAAHPALVLLVVGGDHEHCLVPQVGGLGLGERLGTKPQAVTL